MAGLTSQAVPLTDLVRIDESRVRSINIGRDGRDTIARGSYVLTIQARRTLRRLADGRHGRGGRAWTLTGPYGAGKSAFALYLLQVLCSQDLTGDAARQQLRTTDPELATALLTESDSRAVREKRFLSVA